MKYRRKSEQNWLASKMSQLNKNNNSNKKIIESGNFGQNYKKVRTKYMI